MDEKLKSILRRVHNGLFGRNRRRVGAGSTLHVGNSMLTGVRFHIDGGGNTVTIGDLCVLKNCAFNIGGSGSHIIIGDNVYMDGVELYTEDGGNTIAVGRGSSLYAGTQLAAIEGTRITVGEDCLFSREILLRTGDSHGITNLAGQRLNPSRDITIGAHVWMGARVIVLKGTEVAAHCVVGAGSLLNKAWPQPHCALAGVPAKVVKHDINWTRQRG